MAWSLSRWLMFTRAFQLQGALTSAGLNGFLTAWVSVKRLGLTQSMCVLELLICILLLYTVLALILQNTGRRTQKKGWLVTFVSLDILFCAADI
ncbi:hypothetical protein QBC47DRAFT_398057 [Echria macrotheca]|uniref:Uncharacterized protein n=1 Tax=Echria macrotheca TaxID=438768 RepID=A0AAJ0BLE8_9PEZI|nr:hypothetical protein QBC47DRAFT_398057 [Echria macrotheca]